MRRYKNNMKKRQALNRPPAGEGDDQCWTKIGFVWRAVGELRLMTGGTRAIKELSLRDYKFYSKLIPLCFAVS